ncbi:DUF2786 domain-containing protein [Streptomyces spectabilis]|uniref:DUF2786 domain-containing protein n=1 Tax=Streptomyces spectabilis TaxID=68270 RepID=A0A7W8AUC9_STRST|nr:DUF2786 domain-containing protein [Streptomyces spectabilis]MBB5103580.1 hypothetical protein [Streptomyces spectabilis]MCI3904174.1 DUF2786 domain-containing protein [Streptomyces spectabilis]GGV19936.1 hypothetical protein GCM10010245_33860 [Streptomyces spectabilis]
MDSVIDKAFAAALYAGAAASGTTGTDDDGDDGHGDGGTAKRRDGRRRRGRPGRPGRASGRAAGAGLVDDALDTAASLLAATPSADAEVARRGEEFVRRAWERGWQPADVVRLVRRDLDEDHVRLAAELIRAETRRYAPGRLPARWPAQLAELDALAPWRAPDRFTRATALLTLYRLLLRLPAVEPVGPPPGARAPLDTPPAHGEPRALTRIRALLAKAEATGYPEEAEALTAKAQELMARYSVDEALIAARTHAAGTPGACRVGVDAPYETAKAILLDAVATANRCRAVWNEAFAFTTVVGFEPDLDVVELLYASLLVQGAAAMTTAEADQRAGGRNRTKTFRQAFWMAYAHRVGARLEAAAAPVTHEDGDGALLPVLVARDVSVTDRTERMFPETTTTRVRGVVDGAGWAEGAAAAAGATLHARVRLPDTSSDASPGTRG